MVLFKKKLQILPSTWNQALKPFYYLTYLMNPVYKGKKLTTEKAENVHNCAIIKIPCFLTIKIKHFKLKKHHSQHQTSKLQMKLKMLVCGGKKSQNLIILQMKVA